MIYDFGTEVGALSAPGSTVPFTYSGTIDLAPNDGVPALFGTGERLYMQFEVTTAFVKSSGDDPVANFGVAVDNSATLSDSSHVLAFTAGTITGDFCGFADTDLTLGTLFHLAIPAWEDTLEFTSGEWPNTRTQTTLDAFRAFRYMGIVISVPNSNDVKSATGDPYFTAGAVKARIIKDPAGTAIESNIYPSRMNVL